LSLHPLFAKSEVCRLAFNKASRLGDRNFAVSFRSRSQRTEHSATQSICRAGTILEEVGLQAARKSLVFCLPLPRLTSNVLWTRDHVELLRSSLQFGKQIFEKSFAGLPPAMRRHRKARR
jgi:hypothetical protein